MVSVTSDRGSESDQNSVCAGDDEDDVLKPVQQLFKFNDPTSTVKFRKDGNLILVGDTSGKT